LNNAIVESAEIVTDPCSKLNMPFLTVDVAPDFTLIIKFVLAVLATTTPSPN